MSSLVTFAKPPATSAIALNTSMYVSPFTNGFALITRSPFTMLSFSTGRPFWCAMYVNRSSVNFKNIYDAIRTSKAVYPDVIKKELVKFKEKFKDELAFENVKVDVNAIQ